MPSYTFGCSSSIAMCNSPSSRRKRSIFCSSVAGFQTSRSLSVSEHERHSASAWASLARSPQSPKCWTMTCTSRANHSFIPSGICRHPPSHRFICLCGYKADFRPLCCLPAPLFSHTAAVVCCPWCALQRMSRRVLSSSMLSYWLPDDPLPHECSLYPNHQRMNEYFDSRRRGCQSGGAVKYDGFRQLSFVCRFDVFVWTRFRFRSCLPS